jgi:hypothetical protein
MILTEIDKAYIAGFFDGEGCVGYYNASQTSSRRPSYFHASVNICNTDPRVIMWIQEVTGIGVSRITKFKDGKRRWAYQWQIGKKADVIDFLSTIRPYLRVKGEQVDVLLIHLALEAGYVKKHGSVTPEIVKSRQEISDKLKTMKRMVDPESVETRQAGSSIH